MDGPVFRPVLEPPIQDQLGVLVDFPRARLVAVQKQVNLREILPRSETLDLIAEIDARVAQQRVFHSG